MADDPVDPRAVPNGMTAEKLREIADLMDLFDTILGKLRTEPPGVGRKLRSLVGGEVQTDLRHWANDLAACTCRGFHAGNCPAWVDNGGGHAI